MGGWRRQADAAPAAPASPAMARNSKPLLSEHGFQLDGSHHDWFEGGGERCVLMVRVDDATSGVWPSFFEENDSRQLYCWNCLPNSMASANAYTWTGTAIYRAKVARGEQILESSRRPFGRRIIQVTTL